MLYPEYTNRFKKDIKIVKKRRWNMDLLKEVIYLLCNEIALPEKNNDHSLKGNWSGYRECHIKPDWLLIYQIGNGLIVFDRTGSHNDFFN